MDEQQRVSRGRGGGPGRCPACGVAGVVPVLFGYPTGQAREWAAAGQVILGGCVVSGDDATAGCRACGAQVWPDRVFARTEGARHRVIAGAEWTVHPEGTITVRGGGGEVMLDAGEAEMLLLSLAVHLLDDVAGFVSRLRRLGIGVAVEGEPGTVERLGIDEAGFVAASRDGFVRVSAVDRLTLALVREALGPRSRPMAGLVSWLEELDIAPVVIGSDAP